MLVLQLFILLSLDSRKDAKAALYLVFFVQNFKYKLTQLVFLLYKRIHDLNSRHSYLR